MWRQAEELRREQRALEKQKTLKTKELAALDERLDQRKELLKSADLLASLGFGLDQLASLRDLLAQVAASQGAPPEDGVAQFFDMVRRYERIISLDLEAKRAEARVAAAQADAKRWEAEARKKEAHSKARTATIDVVEKLLGQGVKSEDLSRWATIFQKAGLTPEALATALEKYTSLEALCRDRTRRVQDLQRLVGEAQASVEALRREQAQVQAAMNTVRDGALREMERVGQQARNHLTALLAKAQEYGKLQREAASLEDYVKLAQAFKGMNLEQWAQLPPEVVAHVVSGAVLWAQQNATGENVTPPPSVCQASTLSSWTRVKLPDLLLWALAGLVTEEQRKVLATGR